MPPLGLMGRLNGSISAPESKLYPLQFPDPIRLYTTAQRDGVLRSTAINP